MYGSVAEGASVGDESGSVGDEMWCFWNLFYAKCNDKPVEKCKQELTRFCHPIYNSENYLKRYN